MGLLRRKTIDNFKWTENPAVTFYINCQPELNMFIHYYGIILGSSMASSCSNRNKGRTIFFKRRWMKLGRRWIIGSPMIRRVKFNFFLASPESWTRLLSVNCEILNIMWLSIFSWIDDGGFSFFVFFSSMGNPGKKGFRERLIDVYPKQHSFVWWLSNTW